MRRCAPGVLVGFLVVSLAAACSRPNPAYGGGADGGSGTTTGTGTGTGSEAEGAGMESPGRCEDDNGGCHEEAECIPMGGGMVECACPEGWPGNGMDCMRPLPPLRVELRCMFEEPVCAGDSICPMMEDFDSRRFMPSEPGRYLVDLHVRGVVELGEYTGGEQDGWVQVGGAPAGTSVNWFMLEVEGEPIPIFLNAGGPFEQCVLIDDFVELELQAGDELSLIASPGDDCGLVNLDELMPEDIPPIPFGQFLQVEMESVERI